jgi:HEPN domain-containing protein
MNRLTFQRLAEERIADAKALLQARRFPAAYYMAGYSVECALKACICRRTERDDFPRKDARELYSHNLGQLALEIDKVPGIAWAKELDTREQLKRNLAVVRDWREDTRYDFRAEDETLELIAAIEDMPDGVLTCLRKHW